MSEQTKTPAKRREPAKKKPPTPQEQGQSTEAKTPAETPPALNEPETQPDTGSDTPPPPPDAEADTPPAFHAVLVPDDGETFEPFAPAEALKASHDMLEELGRIAPHPWLHWEDVLGLSLLTATAQAEPPEGLTRADCVQGINAFAKFSDRSELKPETAARLHRQNVDDAPEFWTLYAASVVALGGLVAAAEAEAARAIVEINRAAHNLTGQRIAAARINKKQEKKRARRKAAAAYHARQKEK